MQNASQVELDIEIAAMITTNAAPKNVNGYKLVEWWLGTFVDQNKTYGGIQE